MKYILGIDIGGTKIAVTLAAANDEKIEIIGKRKYETPHDKGWTAALRMLADGGFEILRENNLEPSALSGIGISCGGPLDSRAGLILSPPHLVGWDEVPVTEFFREKFGVPAYLQNDANACALAEWKYGAGRGTKNMIFLTFGTGFGGGLILDGKLYSGTNDMAGEVGHCRAPLSDTTGYSSVGYGKTGSFDGFCSGGGIAQLGRVAALEKLQQGQTVGFCKPPAELDKITAKSVAEAAKNGDETALEVYRCSGRHLGSALAILIDILNPEVIVIGSIYKRSEELLRPAATEVLERESLSYSRGACRILPAELDENLGDIAAISVAINGNKKLNS